MNSSIFIHEHIFPTLPVGWKLEPFSEWVDFQEGPGILAKDFHETGIPLLRLKSIDGTIADLDGCDFLDPNKVEKKWSHFKLKKEDLLLSSSASLGRVSEVDIKTVDAIAYTGIIRMRPAKKDIDKNFIKYFLQSNFFKKQIKLSATGSVINHFGPMHLRQMGIVIPPLKEQRAITYILQMIDDKIEVNKKMNQTLEDISKTLFKSWFKDFNPVKAKVEGRSIGLSKQISDLFSNSFKDSELGKIPKGWSIQCLKDVIEKYIDNRGKTPPVVDSGVPLVEIKHIYPNSQFPNLKTDKYVSSYTFNNYFRQYVKKYDILISTVGTIGLTSIVFNSNFAIAQNILGFRLPNKSLSLYIFYLFKNKYFLDQINSRLIETVQKSIKKKDLNEIPILVPHDSILKEFAELIDTNLNKQFYNNSENEILHNIKDFLLPKLISGELRISDAENSLKRSVVNVIN